MTTPSSASRTAGGSTRPPRVAVVGFQVDDIDPGTAAGWSVLDVGRAYEVTDPGRYAEFPAGWDGHGTAHTVAVPLEQLSGQRIRLS